MRLHVRTTARNQLVDITSQVRSAVREANLMKGVQVGYTTLLEAVLFFYIGHDKTAPAMFITADKELATARVEKSS